MKKRSILYVAALFLGIGAGTAQATHTKFTQPMPRPPVLTGGETVDDGVITPGANPADTIKIVARDKDIVVPGLANANTNPTRFWTLGGFVPPPIIRVPTGSASKVIFVNNLNDIQGTNSSGTESIPRLPSITTALT
jgi:hypothetical protein